MAKNVTDASFDEDVLRASHPVLVDFWAEWCAPCRKIDALLTEIGAEMSDRIEIVKLNIDENPEVPLKYGVLGLPTLTIFKGGEPVQSVSGAKPRSDLVRFIESAI